MIDAPVNQHSSSSSSTATTAKVFMTPKEPHPLQPSMETIKEDV